MSERDARRRSALADWLRDEIDCFERDAEKEGFRGMPTFHHVAAMSVFREALIVYVVHGIDPSVTMSAHFEKGRTGDMVRLAWLRVSVEVPGAGTAPPAAPSGTRRTVVSSSD